MRKPFGILFLSAFFCIPAAYALTLEIVRFIKSPFGLSGVFMIIGWQFPMYALLVVTLLTGIGIYKQRAWGRILGVVLTTIYLAVILHLLTLSEEGARSGELAFSFVLGFASLYFLLLDAKTVAAFKPAKKG